MERKRLRNEKCPCGSGLKYKNCCGHPNKILQESLKNRNKEFKEFSTEYMYSFFKSLPIEICEKEGWPYFKELNFNKMILDCWRSDKFKEMVFTIEGKSINEQQMNNKKHQLLTMSERVRIQTELRFFNLCTPFYTPIAFNIPESFYDDPKLITAYEIYADPISIELRCFGSPYEIAEALKVKRRG